ncbi:tail fiber domain-containing protein [Duganella sp. Root336D2]|uniref:tail fiber domain-containing protein n=1 Tax=Duganella sp. Root336D2 TaxID=1736518 RepID=UPI0006F9C362|nr:tail fiber domain-containing protein [Duganella sp. Root336D2]KQV51366.1 hypothetical protein ASD07_10755 [Duganella sp. Root336D2]
MGWYKNGSVSLIQGNNQVVGVGTDFVTNVNPGAIFCGPDGRIYEVDFITSATVLSLVRSYAGSSVSGTAYAIAPTQSYIVDLARQATALLNTFGSLREDYEAGNLVGAGLKLKGVLADTSSLPASPAEGDAYLVESSIYVWAKTRWEHSSIQGPKGEVGDANPDTIAAAAAALDSKAKAAASEASAQASKNAAAFSESNVLANAVSAANSATTSATKAGEAAASATAAAAAAQTAQAAANQASSGQVQADWTESDPTSKGFVHHKPSLAAVATSGNKADVGLGHVDDISAANMPVSIATQAALDAKVNAAVLGAANGVATLGADGKVPAGQLPSYVDDVIEVATSSALPAAGESGKIYLVIADETRSNTTQQYRWGGSVYIRIATSPGTTDEVPEGAINKYFSESRVLATLLNGLSTATNAVIGAGDSVLASIGKLQAQITAVIASKASKGANSDITSLTGLTSATFSGNVPFVYFDEADQTGAAGKWRMVADSGGWRLDKNTAAARDFSTYLTPINITSAGSCVTSGNVQQGGGTGQGVNKVYIGWGTSNGLKCTVDATDQGYFPFSSTNPTAGTITFGGALSVGGTVSAAGFSGTLTGYSSGLTAYGLGDLASTLPGTMRRGVTYSLVQVEHGWPGWGGVLQLNPNAGVGTGGALQLYTPWGASSGGNDLQFRQGDYQQTGWTGWKKLIDHTIMQYYTAGNANSISNATGGAYTWTNRNWFRNNTGASSGYAAGANSNFGVYADDGMSAIFSFLRSGAYGVNMSLDSDSVFRIGGWSAGPNILQLDMSGNLTLFGDVAGYSDERLKTNWRDVTPGFLERWAKVKHGVFDRIDADKTQVGLSAQGVQEILPEAVNQLADGYLSLNYGGASAVATVQLAKAYLALREELTQIKAQFRDHLEKAAA